MIIYTQTPDYYQEYLEHGWLKDQAAKVHKYLERWRGKNGKWYYRYATNAIKNAYNKTKFKLTNKHQLSDKQFDDRGYSKSSTYYTSKKGTTAAMPAGEYGSRKGNTKAGISAGRKRAAEAQRKERESAASRAISEDNRRGYKRTSELKSKGYKQGNLSKKGYSNSTSGDNSSAIKKSKIVANQKQKALNKRGYYNSKVDTPYKKKPSITKRGYEVGSGQSSDYYRRYNDYDKLYKGDDFILEPGQNYWDKKYYNGYKGPLVLSPVGQENKAKRDLNKAGRAGWLTAARKRAGYVNKKRTKK